MRTRTLRCWINAQSSFWNTNSTTKLLNCWLLAKRWLISTVRCTTHLGVYVPCSFGTSVSYRLSWLLWVVAWNCPLLFYKTDCCHYRRLYFTCTVVCRSVDLYPVDFFLSLTTLSLLIICLSCPPKFSISIVFAFSWDDCYTQEKLKTIGYTNVVYYGQCPTKMVSTEQKFVEVRLNEVAK